MANPQPTDAHGIIAHEIQENLLIRGFTLLQLKIIYLVIRLSWGCGNKAWQYKSYKDFESIGIHRSDVAAQLNYLKNNGVIGWNPKYNMICFNKDFDQWKIPINKHSSQEKMKALIHDSLQNTNDVSDLLTALGINKQKRSGKTNNVSENSEQFNTGTPTADSISGQPKESIYINNIYTPEFEKFYSEYPRPEDKRRSFANWNKQLKTYTAEQLIGAANKYKAAKAGTDKQYIKSSANFLGRDKPFEDYLTREPSIPTGQLKYRTVGMMGD